MDELWLFIYSPRSLFCWRNKQSAKRPSLIWNWLQSDQTAAKRPVIFEWELKVTAAAAGNWMLRLEHCLSRALRDSTATGWWSTQTVNYHLLLPTNWAAVLQKDSRQFRPAHDWKLWLSCFRNFLSVSTEINSYVGDGSMIYVVATLRKILFCLGNTRQNNVSVLWLYWLKSIPQECMSSISCFHLHFLYLAKIYTILNPKWESMVTC